MNFENLNGIALAMELARNGKFIFAIKQIEKENPGISREDAKAAVASFGYGRGSKKIGTETRRPRDM